MSYGLLSLQPKWADGTVIEDLEDAIVLEDGKELKAWAAIAEYMESFEDTDGDGIADVPESYRSPDGRKVVEDSKNLGDLLRNPSGYAIAIVIIFIVLLLIVVLLVVLVVKLIKHLGKKRTRKH